MMQVVDTVSELLQLPREESYEVKKPDFVLFYILDHEEDVSLKPRSEWNPRHAAEIIAASLGAKLPADTSSLFSRGTSPDRKSDLYEIDGRRRGNSVDSFRRTMPLEPSVFVRDRPSMMSFRERSVPSEDTHTLRSLG
ncbi:unnamed protein product [Cylicostephanus goldi]|uniref:Uncharacterized protein n=1 Tax=Cylicostephanus goldi TaxID=71465 RepID=A0A3P6TMD4_CYLGO|nr:unnamed protein product [Cylicostephanus goldi]